MILDGERAAAVDDHEVLLFTVTEAEQGQAVLVDERRDITDGAVDLRMLATIVATNVSTLRSAVAARPTSGRY